MERAASAAQSAFLRLDVRTDVKAQAAAWGLLGRLVDGVGLVIDDFPGLQYSCKVACAQCLQQGRWEGGPEAPAAWELEDVRAAGGSCQFCDKCNCHVELPVPSAEFNPDTQLREVVKQIDSLDALQAPSQPPAQRAPWAAGAANATSSAATTDADATFPFDVRAWRGPTGASRTCCSYEAFLLLLSLTTNDQHLLSSTMRAPRTQPSYSPNRGSGFSIGLLCTRRWLN